MLRARRAVVGGLLAVVTVAALTACTATAMPTPTPTPEKTVAPSGDGVLRIGTLFSMTGPQAAFGAGQVAAVNAAVREINASGGYAGVPVEVVNRDAGDEAADTAATSFAALVEAGADVVIGPSSSAIAARVLPLAAEAGIPLVATGANDPALTDADTEGVFFRTIPSSAHQGELLGGLLVDDGAESVVLVTTGDEASVSIGGPLGDELELLETVEVDDETDAAAAARAVRKAKPDAVVLSTPDGGAVAAAVIAELAEVGFAGERLWLTASNVVDYSATAPVGALDGTRAVHDGVRLDAAAVTRLKLEDPGLRYTRYAAEAYDATVLAALAAVIADDDGGPSIAWRLRQASHDGIPCTSFGACLDVLQTEPAIAYAGLAGPLDLDDAGDPTSGIYALLRYAADGTFALDGTVAG